MKARVFSLMSSQVPLLKRDMNQDYIITEAYLRHTRIVKTKHVPRLHNRRRSGVFSVPCRAEPKRAEERRTNPAVNELPGNAVNTFDDAGGVT
jgi:hypothetical protein